jgi:DNA-binding winged helix-turn-helix (wHTH) protein/TolB-like protein
MPLEEKNLYEFGAFHLKASQRLLLRDREPVPLPPKAFETLLLLVRNSGLVLGKEELMKTLWPNTFVEENNLTQHISLLRRVLGEAGNGERYIETVPKLGYRFAVPVRDVSCNGEPEVLDDRHTRTHIVIREQEEEEISEDVASGIVATMRKVVRSHPRRAVAWFALAGVVAVSLGGAYFLASRSKRPDSQAGHTRALAVLPFRDLKPGVDTQFLSYSLADAIINRLGYFPQMVVRPSSYVAKYRGSDTDPRVVARELHADAILTGNYIHEGDRLRVSAELVDVAKVEVLWRDTIDVPYGELLTIQDRVAENVARGMTLQILPQTVSHLNETAPKNPRAYEYFLRGRDFGPPNNYRYSITMMEKSVELDPNYAPAWMELGVAYGGHADWEGGGELFRTKSQAAFDKALGLDPQLPVARALMAIQMIEHGDPAKGLLTLREELRLNPNEATAHWWLTEAYLYGGMLPESIAEGELALQLDPFVNNGSTLNSYLHAGDYQKFLATLPEGESARTTFYRGLCYLYMHDPTHARIEFERSYTLDPSLLHAKYGKAFIYAIRNQPQEGRIYLRELEKTSPTTDGEMLYKMAQAFATLGDTPSALRLLRETIDHNFNCHACFVRDPLLISLHGESQFAELMNLARDRSEEFKRKYL